MKGREEAPACLAANKDLGTCHLMLQHGLESPGIGALRKEKGPFQHPPPLELPVHVSSAWKESCLYGILDCGGEKGYNEHCEDEWENLDMDCIWISKWTSLGVMILWIIRERLVLRRYRLKWLEVKHLDVCDFHRV